MMPVGMRDQPAAGDARAHGKSSPIPVHPHSDNLRCLMQPPCAIQQSCESPRVRRLSA
jgi:hypothetical protein